MWWECTECGNHVERPRTPAHCTECGTAGAFTPADDDSLVGEADCLRAAWLRAGMDRLHPPRLRP
jgi:hypothetical protein